MSEINPKILSKIKKCLALSKSDNPHEAAAALRQAHAMMEKHGVTGENICQSDIGESEAKISTMSRDKPAAWEAHLAAIVGKAFGCQILIGRSIRESGQGHANKGRFVFIGLKHQSTVAAYTASVLIRKCKSARAKWIQEKHSRLTKVALTKLGNAFAEGWVISISGLVNEFANPPEINEAIAKHIKSSVTTDASPDLVQKNAIDKNFGSGVARAALDGMDAAKGESLYRPMNKNNDAPMLGMNAT